MSTTLRRHNFAEFRLATLEMESGHYLDFTALLALIPDPNRDRLWQIVLDNRDAFMAAKGSSYNHQAWIGGYFDHLAEVMNIACQLYRSLSSLRKLPFELSEALEVLFLHDVEKPFKSHDTLVYRDRTMTTSKENRKKLRAEIIAEYNIRLSDEQENALRYVEGVPDSEYTPGERTMGELAAFCHSCDILSARLWHDKGCNVPAPAWE